MNTQHQCLDCDHQFFVPGQSEDSISPAAQCPQCHSYRTQPGGIPDESNDMMHGIGAMPGMDQQDDMSGNPLQEGILGNDGGWKNRQVRDESFASVRKASPEFETTEIVVPEILYRHAMQTEAAHRYTIQLPHGITSNLHATLGNLQAWVQNPYENGDLRPYYNKYWKVIKPSFTKPSSVQIGVADPTMAEIINHVAQTDDITPLYEFRGKSSKVSFGLGDILPAIGLGAANLIPGVGEIADAGALADAAGAGAQMALPGLEGDAASAAAASVGGASGTGAGGLLPKLKEGITPQNLGAGATRGVGQQAIGLGLNSLDDLFGAGGAGGTGGGQGGGGGQINPPSFYARQASDEDDAFPNVHGEIPKQEDGDYHQQDDGNNHEWQRDLSVNEGGGTDHAPSFQHGGPALQEFMQLIPHLMELMQSGDDGATDPQVAQLHQTLEGEHPGYQDNPEAMSQLIMMLTPSQGDHEDHEDQGHTHENAGGAHEAHAFASVDIEGDSDFLPDTTVSLPWLTRHAAASMTPEQVKAVQEYLINNASELHLEGQELTDTVLSVPTNPLNFMDILSEIQKREPPPAPDSLSAQPPPPAQEEAPPEQTMPMPGMSQQMMSAIERYSADSVATKCPNCGSHTTGLLDDEGTSQCHACHKVFKTEGVMADKMQSQSSIASTWNVDEDLRKEADAGWGAPDSHEYGLSGDDSALTQGVPAADQMQQRDRRHEQDSGHTWLDEDGSPLAVGQEYEMYSDKYDIPDLVRIEAVKPDTLVYTLTGEFGLQHSTELTREEANIERISFQSADTGMDDMDDSLEQNNDDNTGYTGSPERTDISAPTGLVSASVQEKPNLAWLKDEMPKTAGANFTPMEQRVLIDEMGTARNSDMLDLLGTHYVQDADEDQFLFGF